MDSWSETKSLLVVMAVVAACYLIGRWVAEGLARGSIGWLP
jgi:hypothetical protein